MEALTAKTNSKGPRTNKGPSTKDQVQNQRPKAKDLDYNFS
jgi:hypothetical protein